MKIEEAVLGNNSKTFGSKLYERQKSPCLAVPIRDDAHRFIKELLGAMFPHYSAKTYRSARELDAELTLLEAGLIKILAPLQKNIPMDIAEAAGLFFKRMPEVYDKLILDAESITKGDPAAENYDEVILTYPGFLAISIYRAAHEFCKLSVPFFPRLLTEYAHQLTGIDIHPGARIGESFFIDHGTGIVIGETTDIGKNVKIYQGVTLGALSVSKDLAKTKRHPTIGDNVVIYSGATILGGETVIGKGSVIGGNVWLTESVPPYSIVYHKSQIKVRSAKEAEEEPINFVI
ncbi:MAG TPA: serine O-acetyltransferase EpsC [Ignavibacteriales bacterium]|nr:serine O-acetyltransferase EpsC [Ignavibacteriales bacterium]